MRFVTEITAGVGVETNVLFADVAAVSGVKPPGTGDGQGMIATELWCMSAVERTGETMSETRRWLPLLVLSVLVFTAGCSDQGGTAPGDSISDAQAQQIGSQITTASINALNSGSNAPGAVRIGGGSAEPYVPPAKVPVPLRVDYSHTHSCPVFGRIGVTGTLSGSIDSESGDGVVWLQVTETLTDCTFESGVVVNGSPSLTLTGNFTFLGGAPATQQSLTLSGGFRWNFDGGGSGFCAVALTMNLATAGSGNTTVSGTVCGRQVNY